MRGWGAQQRLDEALAALSGEDAALRLRLGQVLEVLGRGGHCFALGFSSLSAYALERCDRSPRWVEGSRCLARRLEALPELRRSLARAQLSWSQVELVARVAQSSNEASWLAVARECTVRELRQLVRIAEQRAREGAVSSEGASEDQSSLELEAVPEAKAERREQRGGTLLQLITAADASLGDEDACTLTLTVNREDAWLFEATRTLLAQMGTLGNDAQVEALLAEGQELLLATLPAGGVDPERWEQLDETRKRWREQMQRWQEQAEERCEERVRDSLRERAPLRCNEVSEAASAGCSTLIGKTAGELDEAVRQLSRALARHELELSRSILEFHRIDGWRALGYATESQYARERLGLSRSSLLARRALAARLETLPAIAEALGSAKIGVEAALQLVRVATPRTELSWVARAARRTVKHLREEVAAALTAIRLSGESDCPPPEEAELKAYAELERAVLSGSICQPASANDSCAHANDGDRAANGSAPDSPPGAEVTSDPETHRAWRRMLESLDSFLQSGGVQMSAAPRLPRSLASAGRVEIRLRVSRELAAWWRGLEAQARRWLRRGMSWSRFLCLSLWRAWRHLLGAEVAYGGVYLRDGYRCRSPVCSRRDVTPHHLQFRSQGGGDEPGNIASVCSWCHLFGIHGGCIRAEGTAEHIRWELGPTGQPCVIVVGRERVAA